MISIQKTNLSYTRVHTEQKNLCSVFIAYFSPGIHDEFLWRVGEEGKNHIQVKPNILLLYSVISKAR